MSVSATKQKLLLILILSSFFSCGIRKEQPVLPFPALATEGHRGGRGLMPENTIAAMLHTIDLGLTTIEMDCHITADGQVIVAHDDYINPAFSLAPDGREIPVSDAKKYALYKMDYGLIKQFDVGSKPYALFPRQRKMKATMPLLSDLIDSVQSHLKKTGKRQVWYDIETKSSAGGDNMLNPVPEKFVDLLMQVISRKGINPFTVIQSFDKRTLQVLHRKYPGVKSSYLLSNNKKSFKDNLAELGFTPFMYSMGYKSITPALVSECRAAGVKLNAWTPNTKEEIQKLKDLGVDGIITDYPDLLAN